MGAEIGHDVDGEAPDAEAVMVISMSRHCRKFGTGNGGGLGGGTATADTLEEGEGRGGGGGGGDGGSRSGGVDGTTAVVEGACLVRRSYLCH